MDGIIEFLLKLQCQLQVLHWQTLSFARHKAYDDILASVRELSDEFVEVYQGKNDRLQCDDEIVLLNIENDDVNGFFSKCISYLQDDLPGKLDEKDTDLLNIRDELMGALNKLKYLLTLQ